MAKNLYDAVVSRESSDNPLATSVTGARGLMQIMPIALTEYNNYNKTNLTMDDMYDSTINKQVGQWYLGTRIPQMLKAYKLPVNTDTMLWSYHDGIGNVRKNYKSNTAKKYISDIKNAMGEK
jgi:soluble lytic murein transglycosylase-like protein